MTAPVVIPPGGGEVVGDAPDRRVEILSDHDGLHATWSRFGPRRDGADLHVHREHADLFYVLEGELTLRLGPADEQVAMPAGTLACVPPLVVHGFRNASDADVRYLNLHAPGREFASFLRALRDGEPFSYDQWDPPADGGRPAEEAQIGRGPVDLEAIAVAELVAEPGSPPRAHVDALTSYHVLDGELSLRAGDGVVRAAPGPWLQVPPGIEHATEPAGSGAVRLLAIRTPAAEAHPPGVQSGAIPRSG